MMSCTCYLHFLGGLTKLTFRPDGDERFFLFLFAVNFFCKRQDSINKEELDYNLKFSRRPIV